MPYCKKFQKNTRSDIKILGIQVFKYSSIQVFKYSSIQVFKYRVYKLVTHTLLMNNVQSRDPIGSKKCVRYKEGCFKEQNTKY